MRRAIVAILTLFVCATSSADTLILKSGKRVDWKVLRDKGEVIELETLDGVIQVVQKKDIERIEFTTVKPVLTGASISFTGKVKTQELLPAVVPKRDLVFGVAKFSGGVLIVASEVDQPTLLRIPVKSPEEYDLTIVVERKSVIGNFYVGLPTPQGRSFLVEFDGMSGSMSAIHGGTSQRGAILEKGSPKVVLVQVRREVVSVLVDKKEVLTFQGSVSGLQMPETHRLPKDDHSLFIGSQRIYGNAENASFQVHRIAITTKPQ